MRDFSIQFFLKVGDLLLTIPVNPEELEITKELEYDTYANLNKKEILKLQEEKLIELELESILERTVSSASVTDKPWKPETYLDTFNGWKDNRTPVRVTCSDGQIDFEGYIVEVTTTYEGGTDDYNYMLKIVQERSIQLVANIDYNYKKIDIEYNVLRYTPPANPTVNKNNNSSSGGSKTSGTSQSGTYTVKRGDTLSSIARAYYGNSSKWPDIFNANKDKIKNANLIYAGQVLTIPNANGKVVTSTSTTNNKSTTNKKTTSSSSTSNKTSSNTTNNPSTNSSTLEPGGKTICGFVHKGSSQIDAYGNSWIIYYYFDSQTYVFNYEGKNVFAGSVTDINGGNQHGSSSKKLKGSANDPDNCGNYTKAYNYLKGISIQSNSSTKKTSSSKSLLEMQMNSFNGNLIL